MNFLIKKLLSFLILISFLSCASARSPMFEIVWRYLFTPDRSLPSLHDLNIVTLLPLVDCKEKIDVVDESKDGRDKVIDILRKKDGIISVQGRLYKIYSGVPKEISLLQEPITLYSGGYSNGRLPYAFSAYKGIKEKSIEGPCIVFEYPTDSRRAFNFGQNQDLHCVDLVYKDILKKYSTASIILKGGCKGAAIYLRFLAEKAEQGEPLENIKAVIANSPPVSVKSALKNIRNGGVLSHTLCRLVFPNYNPRAKTIMDAKAFPANIPVFLASLPHDTISDLSDIQAMTRHLTEQGAKIEHFVSQGIAWEYGKKVQLTHGQIGRASDYQKPLEDFLVKHGLRTE